MKKFLLTLTMVFIGFIAYTQDISGLYCYKQDDVKVTLQLFPNGKCQFMIKNDYESQERSGSYTKDGNTITFKWKNNPDEEYGQYSPAVINRQTGRPVTGKEARISIFSYTLKKDCK
jgi:hypothetical protein